MRFDLFYLDGLLNLVFVTEPSARRTRYCFAGISGKMTRFFEVGKTTSMSTDSDLPKPKCKRGWLPSVSDESIFFREAFWIRHPKR